MNRIGDAVSMRDLPELGRELSEARDVDRRAAWSADREQLDEIRVQARDALPGSNGLCDVIHRDHRRIAGSKVEPRKQGLGRDQRTGRKNPWCRISGLARLI